MTARGLYFNRIPSVIFARSKKPFLRLGRPTLTLAILLLAAGTFITDGTMLPVLAQQEEGAISNLSLASNSPGQLVISWDTPSPSPSDYRVSWARQDLGFLSYRYDNEAHRGNEYPAGDVTSLTLTDLSPGVEYKVMMRSRYNKGQYSERPWSGPWSAEATQRVQGPPPAAPTGLNATEIAHDSVTLGWTAPAHDAITGYRVLRGVDANSLAPVAADTGDASTEYVDATVAPDTAYVYAVMALSPDGSSPRSETTTATTPAQPDEAQRNTDDANPTPAAPTSLRAISGHDRVTLEWDGPADDKITGYRVWRGPNLSGLTVLAADTGSAATSFDDDAVTAETEYHYAVNAINSNGVGPRSESLRVTTLAPLVIVGADEQDPPTSQQQGEADPIPSQLSLLSTLEPPTNAEVAATNDRVTVSWRRNPANFEVAGYRIWRAENSLQFELLESFIPTEYRHPGATERESYVDTDVLPGIDYKYRIRTVTHEGMSEYSLWAHATTAADVPPGLRATATRNSVTLSWEDPEDSAITGYRILRSVDWGRETTLARSVSGAATSYVDRLVSASTAYAYRVQAVRDGRADPASRYVMVLTQSGVRPPTGVSEPSGRDLPAGTDTTGRLAIGGTVSGSIATSDDRDWFAVDLTYGENYFIRLRYEGGQSGGNGPLRITCVRDSRGEDIWPNFSCPFKSSMVFNPTRSGRYYVEVESAWGDLPSDYTIEIHPDIGHLDPVGVGQAQVGSWTSGAFHDQDHEDRYEIRLCGGRRYRVPVFYDVAPASDGRLHPPAAYLQHRIRRLTLYDYTAPLVVKPEFTDTYYLDVDREPEIPVPQGYEPEPLSLGEGTYRFLVEELDAGEDPANLIPVSEPSGGDLPADAGTTGLLPFDHSVTGQINRAGDVDWFRVRFDDRKCDRVYWFDMKGLDTNDGTLADPFIVGLYDARGNHIPDGHYPGIFNTADDNGGGGRNARQDYVPFSVRRPLRCGQGRWREHRHLHPDAARHHRHHHVGGSRRRLCQLARVGAWGNKPDQRSPGARPTGTGRLGDDGDIWRLTFNLVAPRNQRFYVGEEESATIDFGIQPN